MSNKDLNLDKLMLKESMFKYPGSDTKLIKESESTSLYEILRKGDGNVTKILVYHLNGGKTTLQVQGNPEYKSFGEGIIQSIKDNATILSLDAINDMITVTEEDFKILLEMADSNDKINQKDISGGIQYTYLGDDKEKFIFKYFTKKSNLQLIGPPLNFFMKLINILDDLEYNATNRIIENFVGGSIDCSNLWTQYMPNTEKRLNTTQKSIIEPSLMLIKVHIAFPDYGFMLQPVLRGMESSLRKIFDENNIEVDPKRLNVFKKFGDYYILKEEYHNCINVNVKLKVEKCYNFYNMHRHALFHASDIAEEIKCIESRDDAISLLNTSFGMMEELHETISDGG